MLPAMQVFAKLHIDKRILFNRPKGSTAFDHCEIEKVMHSLGHKQRAGGWETTGFTRILDNNRRMVNLLSEAVQQEQDDVWVQEKQIDECAHELLQLCGFADDPFVISSEKIPFRIFGRICQAASDKYVILSENRDLVLIFEDRAFLAQKKQKVASDGHLGQIMAELLQCLSLNQEKNIYRNIFAIRYVNYHVAGFRIDADQATIDTLVKKDYLPDKKLTLQCTLKNPAEEIGWSLINKKERLKALQLMANIRDFILASKDDEDDDGGEQKSKAKK